MKIQEHSDMLVKEFIDRPSIPIYRHAIPCVCHDLSAVLIIPISGAEII